MLKMVWLDFSRKLTIIFNEKSVNSPDVGSVFIARKL
jgi:hypothetical protein